MMKHLVLAYGAETEHQRAIFAVLSFWAWYEGDRASVQTVIFTDCPDRFAAQLAGLPVSYQLLTPADMTRVQGGLGYIHRIKPWVVNELAQQYPGEAIFYCDSDTFFVEPAAPLLRQLGLGHALMHVSEHSFEEAIAVWASFNPPQDAYPRRFVELLRSRPFELLPGSSHRFSPGQMMWNTGVIGLAAEQTQLVPAVLALCDQFYSASEWMMSEQAAFSLALQTQPQTQLAPSSKYVFHYWGQRQKDVMDRLLADLDTALPPAEPLNERLARVRKLTGTWRQAVVKDEAQQAAKLAFSRGELLNGMKFTTKSLLSGILPKAS